MSPSPGNAAPVHSKLWGANGELFDARGRLFDWSYAGYRAGEKPLPARGSTINAKQHGAIGDGVADDTLSLLAALARARPGDVVYLPVGKYRLRAELALPNGVVLRGDGPERTVLAIELSLSDLYGNPGLAKGEASSYSFSEAFISAKGEDIGARLASITRNARRGDTHLQLSSTHGARVGTWVHIDQTDQAGALIDHLYANRLPAGPDCHGKVVHFYARIAAVNSDNIELERALPFDLDLAWSPELYASAPTVSEVGVEHLSLEFPDTSYPGHFKELGYNAIYFFKVFDSWVKNVTILNADYGVCLKESQFVTVSDVTLDSASGRSGHHALNNTDGGDNLFTHFDVRVEFVHDLTNEWYATGIVFEKGKGKNLCLDHHRAAPYATLWTELHLGAGTRPWSSGGRPDRGAHTAAHDTLWNIQAHTNLSFPVDDFGPCLNFVGFQASTQPIASPHDWWFEAISPARLEPANLFEAMRRRRLAGTR